MNTTRLISIAAAASLMLAGCATNSYEKPMTNASKNIQFSELDRNKDGVLTPDELPEKLELTLDFPRYDLNGDGVVSRAEFNEYVAATDLD